MTEKLKVPKFQSEAEEAEWWDKHRDQTARWMAEAVGAGERTTVLRRAGERVSGARAVAVHVDAADAARARALAARKGISWETYIRTLLREALDRDESTG